MKRYAYSRAERKTQVIQTIATAIAHDKPNAMTTNALAKQLQITPSSKFRNILLEMWRDGQLEAISIPHQGVAGKAYVWSLPEGTYQRPVKKTRQIAVKVRGQEAGQLSLW